MKIFSLETRKYCEILNILKIFSLDIKKYCEVSGIVKIFSLDRRKYCEISSIVKILEHNKIVTPSIKTFSPTKCIDSEGILFIYLSIGFSVKAASLEIITILSGSASTLMMRIKDITEEDDLTSFTM